MSSGDQNKIFFSILRHVLDEQEDIDWGFKTSLINLKGFNATLTQSPIDQESQINNIIEYLKEAKPYHTNFSGVSEQYTAPREDGSLDISETINPTITLHFDRVSCEPDLPGYDTSPYDYSLDLNNDEIGYDDFDIAQANLNHAANRIQIYYEPGSGAEKKSLEELMDCDFRGVLVSGGPINIDEIGYDSNFFEKYGYDVPSREAYYTISSTPDLDFTDYETLIDAVTDTEDYGSIADAATTTLDWGSITTPVPAPASSVTFPLPYVIFETKKVFVYYEQTDGSRALTTDEYEVVGFNVVFDVPPPVGVVIVIVVIDYDYLYDKIYATSDDWIPGFGDEEILLDADGFLRPHWDRKHPQELSPVRVVENFDMRIYTSQAQVLGSDPGYDEAPYDMLGYDLAEIDLSLSTGGGPNVETESYYMSEISATHELKTFPQSKEGLLVFDNGLLLAETTDYSIDWTEPTYDDTSERDDHITNPRITLASPPSAATPVTFMQYGLGGATIQKQIVRYDTAETTYDTGITIGDPDYVFATVNGEIATVTVSDRLVTITSPAVSLGSTVAITVFSDSVYSTVRSQEENNSTVTLLYPPSSTVPGYMGISAWDLATGLRLTSPYTKVHLAKAGEDTYSSASPSTGTYTVYLDGVLQTATVDYNVSGTDVVFTSIPSLNTEIIIQEAGTGEFALATTSVANDTFTLASAVATDLRILTMPEDTSSGVRTETYDGTSARVYDVGNIPSEERLLWVYLDGELQYPGVNYTYVEDLIAGTREVTFIDSSNHSTSVVQITYFVEKIANIPVGVRITKGPKGETQMYRIANKHTTELVAPYRSGLDNIIRVKDASVLGQPSPITVDPVDRIPGRIYINNEMIEFWGVDYTQSPHQLLNLRPGSNGTGMGLIHAAGSLVIDASRKQLLPKQIKINKNSQISYRVQSSGVSVHAIIGEYNSPDDVKVWVKEATALVEPLNPADAEIVVTDSSVFTLPGATELVTDVAAPTGSILTGDTIRINLNNSGYEFVTLSGTDAASVKADVESLSSLSNKGLSATVASDIISFSHAGGGDLVIENQTGYALQDLFGGQITGSVTTPVVTFGGGEGITINSEDVVFTGSSLANVIIDINTSGIENIIARDKNDSLQIISTTGAAITVANLVGTALTELGVASSSASTVLVMNGSILQAQGTRSSTKGSLWIDQEKIQFGFYDPSEPGSHVLGDFTRDFTGFDPTTTYTANKVIVGSKLELKTRSVDYEVMGRQIRFLSGKVPNPGSLVRIQNQADTGKIVLPDNIQTSNTSITRFLKSGPGTIEN